MLFISGDGGWNARMMRAWRAASPRQQAIVIGMSYPALKRGSAREGGCWYAASDLRAHLARRAEDAESSAVPSARARRLFAGATLVYAALANTPAVTFAGGISLGFCADLAGREICSGDEWTPDYDEKKHVNHLPATKVLPKDWYILQGAQDQVCPADAVRRFTAVVPKAHFLEVDGTGHGFAQDVRWGALFDTALQNLWSEKEVKPPAAQPESATTRELEDELQRLQLPLEYRWPAQISSLLLFFSGDGGWASLDEATAEELVTRGVGVVGVSSLRYFWNAKSPAQVASDIKRARHGARAQPASDFRRRLLVRRGDRAGGAARMDAGGSPDAATASSWSAPGLSASFEIDPLDWIRTPRENPETRVAPAVRAVGLPTLCLAGLGRRRHAVPVARRHARRAHRASARIASFRRRLHRRRRRDLSVHSHRRVLFSSRPKNGRDRPFRRSSRRRVEHQDGRPLAHRPRVARSAGARHRGGPRR